MNDFLRCPSCFENKLIFNESNLFCDNCKTKYELYSNKPVLVNNEHKLVSYGKVLVNKSEDDFKQEAEWSKEFIDLIPKGSGYLLDYACGGGARKLCEQKGYNYIGVDYFNDYGVTVIAHGENLPFKDNTYSVVTSSAVMEHIPNPWRACSEICRVLKTDGYYVGSTAFLYPYHESSHYNMSHLGVKLMLEQAGLKVIKIIPWNSSGFEAILKTFIGLPLLYFLVYPLIWSYNILFYLRKLSMKSFLIIYRKNEVKKRRIIEYIEEDKLRFTSEFTYLAVKR